MNQYPLSPVHLRRWLEIDRKASFGCAWPSHDMVLFYTYYMGTMRAWMG